MINIAVWLKDFSKTLNDKFSNRIWFIGLQGSYARGEATDTSDIDTVVILDELTVDDINVYNEILNELPYRELMCGFLSGKSELLNWEPSELFQFYYDTVPIQGSLDELLFLFDQTSITKAIKNGACAIYHGCVHNMLYDKSEENLKALYKSASFVIQAIYYTQTGNYVRFQNELIKNIRHNEQTILNIYSQMKSGANVDFQASSELLFIWAGNLIKKTK